MTRKNALLTHMGVATCAVAVLLTGCATSSSEQKGAGTGAVIGAVAGQILGRDSKSTAIGAGLGALGGYIWSKQMEDKNAPWSKPRPVQAPWSLKQRTIN